MLVGDADDQTGLGERGQHTGVERLAGQASGTEHDRDGHPVILTVRPRADGSRAPGAVRTEVRGGEPLVEHDEEPRLDPVERRIDGELFAHATQCPHRLGPLAGAPLEKRKPLDGVDVWNTVSAGKPSPRDEVVYNIEPTGAGIRKGDWKLVWQATLAALTPELMAVGTPLGDAWILAADEAA